MKLFFVLLSLSSLSINAETLKGNFELQSSKIDYLVKYLIKKADGTSTSARGKGVCSDKGCDFLVAAPIKSFESKDSNRDLNMLNSVKADKYPVVSVMITTDKEVTNNKMIVNLDVEFAGVKKTYEKVPFEFKKTATGFTVAGAFDLVVDAHKVEKPSLLGVDIENIVPITISAQWISK